MVSRKRLLEYEANAWQVIRECGWMVQGVGASSDEPQFCYTVGFSEFDRHPEVIVFGLSFEMGQVLLNDMGAKIRDGHRYSAGDILDDLVHDYKAMLIAVDDTREHLTMANRLYRRGNQKQIEALQLILPDKEHRWPWEPNATLTYPVLGQHP